jgi:hypothetical protein
MGARGQRMLGDARLRGSGQRERSDHRKRWDETAHRCSMGHV